MSHDTVVDGQAELMVPVMWRAPSGAPWWSVAAAVGDQVVAVCRALVCGAVAGPLFAGIGFFSNTVLAASSVLAMGLIVWFRIPEPRITGKVLGHGAATPKLETPS